MKKLLLTIGLFAALCDSTVNAQDGIIGNSTIEATNVTSFPGRAFGFHNSAELYTASAGDAVDTLSWYGDWGSDGTDLTIEIGVYSTVDASGHRHPGTLIGSAGTITVNSGTKQWWPVVVDISLSTGVEYTVAWVTRSSHSYEARRKSGTDGMSQDFVGGGALPSTWSHNAHFAIVFSCYANIKNTPTSGVPLRRRRLPNNE